MTILPFYITFQSEAHILDREAQIVLVLVKYRIGFIR